MTTIDLQRHQMIKKAVMQRPDAIGDVSLGLWERLAYELVSIIGEGGFQSLFQRSLHLTSASFPWMELDAPLLQHGTRFTGLKNCLDAQDPAEAGKASTTLLITFIDILALLIGEHLTSSILNLAWSDDALDKVVKELG